MRQRGRNEVLMRFGGGCSGIRPGGMVIGRGGSFGGGPLQEGGDPESRRIRVEMRECVACRHHSILERIACYECERARRDW